MVWRRKTPPQESRDRDAELVRRAIHKALPSHDLDTEIGVQVLRRIKALPRESAWEAFVRRLEDFSALPQARWGVAMALLLLLLLPVGYIGGEFGGLGDGASVGEEFEYLGSGIPGATIVVQTVPEAGGTENEIVWVIGTDGASL